MHTTLTTSIVALAVLVSGITGDSKTTPKPASTPADQVAAADVTKRFVEAKLETALFQPVTSPEPRETNDETKMRIERPLEEVLETTSASVHDGRIEASRSAAADKPANPRVRPGLVQWAKDFDTAVENGRRNGKPVLLFQLLGQLDQRFT